MFAFKKKGVSESRKFAPGAKGSKGQSLSCRRVYPEKNWDWEKGKKSERRDRKNTKSGGVGGKKSRELGNRLGAFGPLLEISRKSKKPDSGEERSHRG